MRDPIQKYFDIGTIMFMSYPGPGYPYAQTLKKILVDPFFSAIEVTKVASEEDKPLAKKMLDESGIRVCFGAQPLLLGPKLNPNAINEEDRQKAEAVLMNAIDEAEYLGSKGIAFLSGNWEQETKDEAYAQLLKTTRNVCDYAKTKDMIVELEVFDFDMDKKSLIGPAPYAAQFAADMRTSHSNFGLMIDLSHFPTTYETSKFVVQTLRPYITHFHIGSAVVKEGCEAFGDMHPRFNFPNSANTVSDLVEFFNILKEEGFFCPENPYVLSFEVKPWGDEDADLVVANTKRVINRAWALVKD